MKMLSFDMKRKINTLRDILVGKVPDPKSQVEQITIAMVFKFMDDMDKEFLEDQFFGGERKFFVDTDKEKYSKYAWTNIMNPQVGGQERADLYREGIEKMQHNPNLPDFFKDIFRNAYIPFRDSETINLFLKEVNEFSYDNSEDLGEAFEMLLSIMSSQGDAGQFRTPRHIIDMIVDIVQPTKLDKILDPACGTAGFLISAYRYILGQNKDDEGHITLIPDEKSRMMQNFEGYDISQDMVRLSRVNMYLHHFPKPKIYEYDTLTSLDRWDDQFDVIFANPPFMTPKGGINPHNRFRVQANRSEVLFVDYIAEHLAPNGRAGVIVPEGIVFKAETAYKELRKLLVDDQYLYGVISLPAGVFNPYSGVKTSILLFDKAIAKQTDKLLFVKIENEGFDLGAQRRRKAGSDIPRTVDLINAYKNAVAQGNEYHLSDDQQNYAIIVQKEKISEQSYFLVGDKYALSANKVNAQYPQKKLGELCSFMTGGTPRSGCEEYYIPSEIPWLVSGDIKGTIIESCSGRISQAGMDNSNAKTLPYNSVLIALNGQGKTRGTVALLKIKNATSNQSIVSILPNNSEELNSEFLFYQLQSMYQEIREITGDNQRSGLNIPILKTLSIVVPPIEIQKQLMSQIGTYQKVIGGAKQVVENYKPTIMIKSTWKTILLADICTLKYGFTETAKDYGNARFIRITDIDANGCLKVDGAKYIDVSSDNQEYILKKNDLLVARTGATFGKTLIFTETYPAIYASFLIKIILDSAQVLPMYYWAFAQTYNYWEQANSLVTGGGQPQFNANAIKQIRIPIPPIEEQQIIVEQISEEMEIVAQNKLLIEIFEKKIADTISQVWGSTGADQNVVPFSKAEDTLKFAARNCSETFIETVQQHKDSHLDE